MSCRIGRARSRTARRAAAALVAIGTVLPGTPSHAQEGAPAIVQQGARAEASTAWSRAELVRAALADPSFAAFEQRAEAAVLRAEAAQHARPPLVLDAQVAALPIETRQGAQWWTVGAAQRLPNGQARDARGAAFTATAEAAREARDAALIEHAWQIDQALVAIARAEAHIALLDERRALLDAQQRWIAEVAPHEAAEVSALPRLALRIAVLDDRQQALREEIAAQHETLRALTGADVRDVAPGAWADARGDEFDAHAMPAPVGHEPQQRALLAQAEAADARARAAEVSERVTPTLSLRWSGIIAYDQPGAEPGRDALMLGVALPLPTSSRTRTAEADAARADAAAAREQARSRAIAHDAAWYACEVRWQDAVARLERAEQELRPLAHDVVRALEPTLAVDAAAFDRWLAALAQELDVEALAIEARFDAALERARARRLGALELDQLRAWREEVRS